MHASSFFSEILIWSAQAFLLVCGASVGIATIAHPKARLLVWQGLLLALLLLPALEPWKAAPAEASMAASQVASAAPFVPVAAAHGFQWRSLWQSEDWLWVIGVGAVLRLLWVAAGFVRLRRYRKQGTPLAGPPLRFASDAARWYASDSVPGPVTYGCRQPIILLPSRVLALPEDLREAIQCHELIHVRRGDWVFVLAETLVRSLLWFHPAIWFVLSRIQLAREQAVDQEVVELLQNRDRYLDALVAVAEYRLQPDLAPAPLFLRKRHLAARVESVMKEMDMSRSRILAGAAMLGSALSIAAVAAVGLFPFVSPAVSFAQTAPDSPGILVNAGAGLLHRAPVRTPAPFTPGTVILQATLNAEGEVTDAQVLSGPQELRKEALSSVLQWHYRPGPSTAQISIQFAQNATSQNAPSATTATAVRPAAPPPPPPGFTVATGAAGGRGGGPALAGRGTPSFPARLGAIQLPGMSPEAEQELRKRLPVREGDMVTEADIAQLQTTIREFDPHLSTAVFWQTTGANSNVVTVQARVGPRAVTAAQVASPPAMEAVPAGTVRQSQAVQSAKLINGPKPAYPTIAKQARIQGVVTLQALIAKDGTVEQLQVLESANPLLTPAAMEAVKQWVYQPTILNGAPVEVATTVDVNFSLQ